MGKKSACGLKWVFALALSAPAAGQMRITEYMYNSLGAGGAPEFVEFTNIGAASIDMTGWSFDDSSRVAGSFSLSSFGVVAPNESVIICEGVAATFQASWGLALTVKIIGGNNQNLARSDEINLYDNANALVDRLTYNDQVAGPPLGGPRTQGTSAWPCREFVGLNSHFNWVFSASGDSQGSHLATTGDLGSPGNYVPTFCGPPPTGACCNLGNCTDGLEEQDCIDGGGIYQGDNTTCAGISCPVPSGGDMRITEYMYTGNGLEFVEFTNLDDHPIDMTGWSYDDDSAIPGIVDLSAFGVVAAGESVILAEAADVAFIADWNLSGVSVIGSNTTNLSRNDQINLFDNGGALIDRLSYGDQTFPGTIRAQNISGWPCEDGIGTNSIFDWFLSKVPDVQNSYPSSNGDVGNPGTFIVISCQFCGNGVVDGMEECDGGDCCTPTCTFVPMGTECRASAGVCDVAETCNGVESTCPADMFVPPDTLVCRDAAGDCDIAEECSGTSADCPADEIELANVECRPAAGVCDAAEVCDGLSPECPADGFDTGLVCRPVDGDCDSAESCDGSGIDCPADAYASGTVCRPADGDCDLAESCDGTGPDCPADSVAPSTTECRSTAGDCDEAENCDGVNVDCPVDDFNTGATCRPSTGPCDPAELCGGASVDCPPSLIITGCANDDGCCPAGCNANNDDDCSSICGNGIVEEGEQCDDGNSIDGDGCSAVCILEGPDAIPTVSAWGLAILSLLLLIGAKLRFRVRGAAVA